jgi:hypothetical protein
MEDWYEESAQEISENIAKTESYTGSNILIAYFTWADNTNVEDKDAAVQSALSHYDSVGDSAETAINKWLDNLGFVVAESNSESVKERKLRMIVDGQEISITLYDTPAANALYDMLPLDLNFEDFNGIEKISYLSQELPTVVQNCIIVPAPATRMIHRIISSAPTTRATPVPAKSIIFGRLRFIKECWNVFKGL